MLRYLTGGESHGPALTGIIEGLPAGLYVDIEIINRDLAQRQMGYGRGERMAIEADRVRILSGMRGGVTLGSPISFLIENNDYENWQDYMNPVAESKNDKRVTAPRPGHADLTGALKYRFDDARNVLERASARETATRVVVGSICRQLLERFGVQVYFHVVNIGGIKVQVENKVEQNMLEVLKSPLFMRDKAAEQRAIELIDAAKAGGESVGGIFEIVITGVPAGLGSYVHWDRKLDAKLAFALQSIQAIKGVEFGCGFECADLPGSAVHDEIFYSAARGYSRNTNNAGGIEGGMSNGESIIIRCAMKPIPTLKNPLRSVDIIDHSAIVANSERSDICAVPAAAVVGAAVAATVVAEEFLRVFGGDSIEEMEARWRKSQLI
ncbi:MAG: chorismate synthase [Negativicutes bacterium]|jgi:chorismate synthase